MTLSRRFFLCGSGALALSACVPPDQSPLGRMQATLRIIEAKAGGTLGVEIYDTQTGLSVGLNRDRRFGHCSSFKLSLAAMVLALDAAGESDASRRVTWTRDDLMHVSPFTEKRLDEGASLLELAEYTQKYSDNTAANVLLRELGGPAALTAFWRSIGDDVSRLDRTEPELGNVPVTEYRDTTTPAAMARTVAKLLYGDILPEPSKAMLRQWMIDTPTGRRRVRAGLPEGWVAGDKTGTSTWPGMGSLYVDIGFVEPPEHPPITFATYYRANETFEGMDPESEAALASVGEVIEDFAKRGESILPF
ncbi:MAG: class A beta-lactamase [Erythrobacter sp.]|uniref:class A beta-lactamase n=1 Tax=Erythrobacter sp. TaxID=1042 RepID=UPI0032F04D59